MAIHALRLLATALIAILLSYSVAWADTGESADIIPSTDPRFNVFELSNAVGGGTYANPVGTVLLSFISKDVRYCRTARLPADRTVVLACREEQGWKIEATSDISQAEAAYTTNFGGGYMQEVGDAVQTLMASIEPMDEFEIIEAASKGWLDPVPVDEQTFDARDILRKTAQVYRASKSYVDTGTVQTVYKNSSREWTGETKFRTAYVAPSEFRFESNMRDMPGVEADFIAWRDQNGVKAWYNLNPDITKDIASIQSALDTGAGISRDTSGLIPGLIFYGTKLGGDIVRLANPVRLEDAEIDGFDCFQVQGKREPHDGPTIVWIDKESFLIRRIYEEDEIRDATTKTTWYYKPELNGPVDEDALQFDMPAP